MNERIRQLMLQATMIKEVNCEGYLGRSYTRQEEYFDKEKFAELIVRECALVAKTLPHTPERHWVTDSVTYIPVHCEQNILKHFGVEEQEKVAPKPKCSVCGTTENVRYMGGYQPYLCDSVDCIPF